MPSSSWAGGSLGDHFVPGEVCMVESDIEAEFSRSACPHPNFLVSVDDDDAFSVVSSTVSDEVLDLFL